MVDDFDQSLGDAATFAGQAKRRPSSEMSLGDERTLGGAASGQDAFIDEIEVVDLDLVESRVDYSRGIPAANRPLVAKAHVAFRATTLRLTGKRRGLAEALVVRAHLALLPLPRAYPYKPKWS